MPSTTCAASDNNHLSPTTYQLLIELVQPCRLSIGRHAAFGSFDFPAGFYLYTGSARRNFAARVARHLRRDKTLRWHIDYLLADPAATVRAVRQSRADECMLCQAAGGDVLVPGFGASDCRAGCGSHLRYLGPASSPALADWLARHSDAAAAAA